MSDIIVAVNTDDNDCKGCWYSCPSRQKECSAAKCCLSTEGGIPVIYKNISLTGIQEQEDLDAYSDDAAVYEREEARTAGWD